MRVLVTRSEPGASETGDRLIAAGYLPIIEPVFVIEPIPVEVPFFDALAFTSANGARQFATLSPRRDDPVFCVGARTAEAAREAGFKNVTSADGDADALAQAILASLQTSKDPEAMRRRAADFLGLSETQRLLAVGAAKASELAGKLEEAGLEVTGTDHAHALHSPYWWLKCAVGVEKPDHPAVQAYHRLLVWDMMSRPALTRVAEAALNPLVGKSIVLYFEKPDSDGPAI